MSDENTWLVWSKHVLKELERLDREITGLEGKCQQGDEKVTNLRIKVAAIAVGVSSITAILSSVATSLIVWLITK